MMATLLPRTEKKDHEYWLRSANFKNRAGRYRLDQKPSSPFSYSLQIYSLLIYEHSLHKEEVDLQAINLKNFFSRFALYVYNSEKYKQAE